MPIHDWTRVDAGIFHAFHQDWTISLCHALNGGILPPSYFALPEQVVSGPIPDVLTLHEGGENGLEQADSGALAVATSPPRASKVQRADLMAYAAKANRITIRHTLGRVVAILEIVSPGNKSSRHASRAFVEKAVDFLQQGIHLLIVDLFPPGKRDPHGIHKEIWDGFEDEPFELPPNKPLTVVSYIAGLEAVAYIEPVAVGDALPDMSLFLTRETYVPVPLEATYQSSFRALPSVVRKLLETNLADR